MQIHFCSKHPQEIANYKCYQCKTAICKDCRLPREHHYFCGQKCFYIYKLENFKALLLKRKFSLLLGSQILLLLLLLAQFLYFQHKMGENSPAVKIPPTAQPAKSVPPPAPAQPDSGLAITTKKEGGNFILRTNVRPGWLSVILKNKKLFQGEVLQADAAREWKIPMANGQTSIEFMLFDENRRVICAKQYRVNHAINDFGGLRESISRFDKNFRSIAFTFDGGADSLHAREILSILRGADVRCTIFLTGKFMRRFPQLVKLMLRDGHEIGNHLYNHPHLTNYANNRRHQLLPGVNRDFIRRQLLQTDSAFARISGEKLTPYWRAPYGEYNRQILDWAAELGYRHIRWTRSFDTFDWVSDQSSKLFRTPKDIYEHFIETDKNGDGALNGAIVLMHLGSGRKNGHIYEALPKLFRELRARGYRFCKISEMMLLAKPIA